MLNFKAKKYGRVNAFTYFCSRLDFISKDKYFRIFRMKGKILFQSLVLCLCCAATSCVDSKYDLSDVDTDDLVVGDEWVAPLGTGTIAVDDVIKV